MVRVWPRAGKLPIKPQTEVFADQSGNVRVAAQEAGLPLLMKPLRPLALKFKLNRILAAHRVDMVGRLAMLSTLAVDGVLHKGVDNCMSGLCGAAVKRVVKISPRIHDS